MSEDQYHQYAEQLPDTYSGADFELDSFIQADKARLVRKAQEAVQAVKDGYVDELKAYAYTKKLCEVATLMEANLRPIVAASARVGKVAEIHFGVEIKRQETGVKYDFTACGCPKWSDLKMLAERTAKELKEHEELLKALKQPTTMVYIDEVYTCNPPIRTSTDGFTSKIK